MIASAIFRLGINSEANSESRLKTTGNDTD